MSCLLGLVVVFSIFIASYYLSSKAVYSLSLKSMFFFRSKVTDTQKNITSYKEQLDEHSDRIYAMSEHLRNVQQELQHTQVNRNYH